MIIKFKKYFLFLFLFSGLIVSFKNSFAADIQKDLKIKREFACIENHKELGQAFDWKDVCSMKEESPLSQQVQRRESEIEKALNYETNKRIQPKPSKGISSQETYFASSKLNKNTPKENQYSAPGIVIDSQSLISEDRKKHEYEIGTEIYHTNYKEPVFNLENKGLMYGLNLKYVRRIEADDVDAFLNDYNFRFEGRIAYGRLDYKSDGSGFLNSIPDLNIEVRTMLARDFDINSKTALTPYFGFGYRFLSDDSSGQVSSVGDYGYKRESNYWYIPLGVEVSHKLENGWILGFICEGDLLIIGRQLSHLSDVPGYGDVKNTQNVGYGLRGSIKFVKPGEKFDLVFEPFVRYWFIDDSDLATSFGNNFIVTGLEPENNTFEMGIKLAVQY